MLIIQQTLITIGERAFRACAIDSITIPRSVTEIKDETFSHCSNLKQITIPNSVSTIGNQAFIGCSILKKIIFEDGTTDIYLVGKEIFYDCPLEEIHVGRNISHAYYSPFSNLPKLYHLTIGPNVSYFSGLFQNCTGLSQVIIEDRDSELTLDPEIFKNCPLDSLYIGGK